MLQSNSVDCFMEGVFSIENECLMNTLNYIHNTAFFSANEMASGVSEGNLIESYLSARLKLHARHFEQNKI